MHLHLDSRSRASLFANLMYCTLLTVVTCNYLSEGTFHHDYLKTFLQIDSAYNTYNFDTYN